jgi:DUF4097 and DUF4098 domain-containing protein YvlB
MKKKWLAALALILVLLGLCAAMITILVFAVRQIPADGIEGLKIDLTHIKAEGDENKSFTSNGLVELDVRESFGKVYIQTEAGNQIVVKAHKTAFGFNQQDADNELASFKLGMNQEGNKITVTREIPYDEPGNIKYKKTVDYTITVPEETTVTVKTDFGEIHLKGTTGKADLHTFFGLIDISNIQGELAAVSDNGAIHANHILAGIKPIDLHSGNGEIILTDSTAGDVTAKSDLGRITLSNVEASGALDINSSFGAVDFQKGKAQSLNVRSNNGGLSLTSLAVEKNVSASSDFGGITLKQVSAGAYDVSSKNGNISMEGVNGPVKADSDFGRINISQSTHATLDLRTSNGNILFEGSLGEGPHTIRTDFGAVTLNLPADAALNVDLKTDFGSIKSDYEMNTGGAIKKDKNWIGKIGNGGPFLSVQSNNGNITIEKIK